MNIDELKSNWNSMDVPPAYHGENVREILSRVESGRVSTLRDRLSGISRGLMAMCMAGLIIMIPYFSATPTLAFFAVCFFVFLGYDCSLHNRSRPYASEGYRDCSRHSFGFFHVSYFLE